MTDADLAVRITALKQAVSKAKAAIEQRRQEADALSKDMAARSADNAKLQAELDKLQAVAEFDARWQRVCREHLYPTLGVVRQRTKTALPPKADMCRANSGHSFTGNNQPLAYKSTRVRPARMLSPKKVTKQNSHNSV